MGTVVLFAGDAIGSGDEQLGRILIRSFVKTLKDLEPGPQALLFLNAGVRLTSEGSELLEDLREFERRGVQLGSCGTCLDFYHLKDKLCVGQVTNMSEIVGTLARADRVLRP